MFIYIHVYTHVYTHVDTHVDTHVYTNVYTPGGHGIPWDLCHSTKWTSLSLLSFSIPSISWAKGFCARALRARDMYVSVVITL